MLLLSRRNRKQKRNKIKELKIKNGEHRQKKTFDKLHDRDRRSLTDETVIKHRVRFHGYFGAARRVGTVQVVRI